MTGKLVQTADPELAFGLVLTPGWITKPITDQLDKPFAELGCGPATLVLEGIIWLQWIRAAIVGGILVALSAALPQSTGDLNNYVSFVRGAFMLWLPMYMGTLTIPWVILKRRSRETDLSVGAAHPALLKVIRRAPLIAFPVAVFVAFISFIVM